MRSLGLRTVSRSSLLMLSPGAGRSTVVGEAPVQRITLGVVISRLSLDSLGLTLTVQVAFYRISI